MLSGQTHIATLLIDKALRFSALLLLPSRPLRSLDRTHWTTEVEHLSPQAKHEPVDTDLMTVIREQIELYDTDAGADEVLAGHLLKQHQADGSEAFLPNLRVNKKDCTHAVKRTMT